MTMVYKHLFFPGFLWVIIKPGTVVFILLKAWEHSMNIEERGVKKGEWKEHASRQLWSPKHPGLVNIGPIILMYFRWFDMCFMLLLIHLFCFVLFLFLTTITLHQIKTGWAKCQLPHWNISRIPWHSHSWLKFIIILHKIWSCMGYFQTIWIKYISSR